MDGANWRPTQGPDPATVDPNAGGQWSRRQVPILLFPLGHAAAAAASASSSSSIHPPIELLLDPHRIESKSRGMDGANWRPIQGPDPNAGGDWRTQLQPEARSRIVNKIMETLKKHLPVSVPEGLSELQKIAERFEEKVYTAATSQSDYLRKISLKMLSMEKKTQQPSGNAQVIPNQNPSGPVSVTMSKEGSRAFWNFSYEKALVDILRDHNNPKFRGQNGWLSEGWRSIVSKFNEKFPTVHFTKQQIQGKEKELKGNYKAIRDAQKQSGMGWNDSLCMIVAEPSIWDKIIHDHPKVKKFRNKPFLLFNYLAALYEGQLNQLHGRGTGSF